MFTKSLLLIKPKDILKARILTLSRSLATEMPYWKIWRYLETAYKWLVYLLIVILTVLTSTSFI